MVGSSLGVPWFILGSSLVFNPRGIGKVQGKGILRKVLFREKAPEYHSGAMDIERREIKEPPPWMALLVLLYKELLLVGPVGLQHAEI